MKAVRAGGDRGGSDLDSRHRGGESDDSFGNEPSTFSRKPSAVKSTVLITG
jgi:hypothetical protein